MSFRHRHHQLIRGKRPFAPNPKHYLYVSSLLLATTFPLLLATAAPAQPTLAQSTTEGQIPSETNIVYVNPQTGDDSKGEGSERSPWKTLTQALKVAPPKSVILLAPGTYSAQTGEQFPLLLKTEVTLQGNPSDRGSKVIIQGNGTFVSPIAGSQQVAIAAVRQAAGLKGITMINPHPQGYGLWIEGASPQVSNNTFSGNGGTGIAVTGNSTPAIANNYLAGNGSSGILVEGTATPQIRDNQLLSMGVGIMVRQNAAPLLWGNQISYNRIGVMLDGNAQAQLRNNTVESSTERGLVVTAQARADLGTEAEPGHNYFSDTLNPVPTQDTVALNERLSDSSESQLNLPGSNAPMKVSPSDSAAVPPVNTSESAAQSREISLSPQKMRPPAPPANSGNVALPSSPPATLGVPTPPQSLSPTPTEVREITLSVGQVPSSPQSSPPLSAPTLPQQLPAAQTKTEINLAAPTAKAQPLPPSQVSPVAALNPSAPKQNRQIITPLGNINSQPNPTPPVVDADLSHLNLPPLNPPPQSLPPTGAIAMVNSSSGSASLKATAANAGRKSLAELLVVIPRAAVNANIASVPNSNPPSSPQVDAPATYSVSGQRYRVIVSTGTTGQEAEVRSLYPDAFPTLYEGKSLLQVGVFSNRENAETALQSLEGLGVRGFILQ